MDRENSARGTKRERHTDRDEARVWGEFYRRVADPATAAELITYLDQDEAAKARHPGLYLRCRQTLRREKARIARARRMGFLVRALLHGVFVVPCAWLRKAVRFCGVAGEACVAPDAEPAVGQLSKIRRSGSADRNGAAMPAQEKGAARRSKAG
ncbi:hypothetical protein [Pseudoduganella violacea]|uniref:Uncharacterized protein n=1 Tax=Pseudoduganella violacea TaxID=1715466 RepID=A0A7W5BEN6_9BURK|nr:hypothetical protein [Pseudoduganella violacea]MBB3121724.1 hypothetical protein [Pseudoduganella violacea]